MRIDSQQNIKWLLVNDKEKISSEKTMSQTTKKSESDEFQFNVSASELNEFFQLAKQADEVRESKLNELKEKVESGEYSVTGKDVVAKIIEGRVGNGTNY
jgi:anti-sigma28 factor (negative regulator of flagellin synthesis)